MAHITKDQFIKKYAERSGLTVDELFAEIDDVALPCACNYEKCQGWAMVQNDPLHIQIHNDLYGPGDGPRTGFLSEVSK